MTIAIAKWRTFVALLLVAIALTACDGGTAVGVRIVDEKHRPIFGAKVLVELLDDHSVTQRTWHGTTAADGSVRVYAGTHAPGRVFIRLSVAKEGFAPYITTFVSRSSEVRGFVQLQPCGVGSFSTGTIVIE